MKSLFVSKLLIYSNSFCTQGELSEFSYSIAHTIEDLYGTWVDENGFLSLQFLENGDVRIADSTGLIGVELMIYSKFDANTLTFKAKADGRLVNLLSFNVDYELLGKNMQITVLGQTFEMVKTE